MPPSISPRLEFYYKKASIPLYFDACPTLAHIASLDVDFNQPFSGSNINHHGFSGVWVFCVPGEREKFKKIQ